MARRSMQREGLGSLLPRTLAAIRITVRRLRGVRAGVPEQLVVRMD